MSQGTFLPPDDPRAPRSLAVLGSTGSIGRQALDVAARVQRARKTSGGFELELGGFGPTAVKDLPMRVVIPAFVISELQTAFQMGFLLFLPEVNGVRSAATIVSDQFAMPSAIRVSRGSIMPSSQSSPDETKASDSLSI